MKKLLTTLLLTVFVRVTKSINCYSCASFEYRLLFERDSTLSRKVRVPKFDRLCDMEDMVQNFAPVETCQSTCVTIYEPQYFGGLQSLQRPYLFIRGCADNIFSAMKTQPTEVAFLHRAPICVRLQLSQIYPQVQANEIVEVCSCDKDVCNYSSTKANSSINFRLSFFVTLLFIIVQIML